MSEYLFTRQNLDQYLNELAKDYRKRSGKSVPAEIILIGGASILINYGFREMTNDMDAIIHASSSMKDAINSIGDKYGLPNGWLNTDFINTASYSPRIYLYSSYYRTFSNIVTFRTITGKHLVAMKLMAGRQYKYDLSDVIGILLEEHAKGCSLSIDDIRQAAIDLYGSYDMLPESSRFFIERAITTGNYAELYQIVRKTELDNKNILLQFQDDYPNILNTDNVNDILTTLRRKTEQSDTND